jgi:hypothetical protein
MAADPEVAAMGTVSEALDGLDPSAQARVIEWASKRYDVVIADDRRTARKPEEEVEKPRDGGEGGGAGGAFGHFADLYDAVSPSADVDRALVGAYWFQVVQGQESFNAAQVNNALKDVGHGVSNIARALANLQDRSPALVRQLSKSGRSQQARKTYKLTTAGVAEIKTHLG